MPEFVKGNYNAAGSFVGNFIPICGIDNKQNKPIFLIQ